MKKKNLIFLVLILPIYMFIGCSSDDDNNVTPEPEPEPIVLNDEVNDFIWKGLNEIYLWQENVPNLADTKDDDQDAYYTFLNSYSTPEDLFNGLLYQEGVVDRFSFLVDDYVELENSFQGTSKSDGVDFRLARIGSSDDVFGYVRYIAKNSDASTKDIKRGDFFLEVDGQQLTVSNYESLLFGSNDTYTLGMADIVNNSISSNGKTVELTKTEFTENPILLNKVIDVSGTKVGYLMYNNFIADFDDELNNAFIDLKSQGVTELILDLRYNPGGRVSSAIILSSLITGQFTGEVFSTERWNSKYQSYFQTNDPESLTNKFTDELLDGTSIAASSLNLSKVYILTTDGSASASELVINCLKPYINVVQIGTTTYGKYTASVTLYDSPNYGRDNVNPNHNYALQPIVLKSLNANGVTDYNEGLLPDYEITYTTSSGTYSGENLVNMGELGKEGEPFLDKALSLISGNTRISNQTIPQEGIYYENLKDSNDFTILGKGMYTDLKPMK